MTSLAHNDPWELLALLRRLIAERAPAEKELGRECQTRQRRIERQYQQRRQAIDERFEHEKTAADAEHHAAREELAAHFLHDQQQARDHFQQRRQEIVERFEQQSEEAEDALRETRWQSQAVFETERKRVANLGDAPAQLDALWQELEGVHQQAVGILRRRWLRPTAADPPPGKIDGDPLAACQAAPALAREQVRRLAALKLPRAFEGLNPFWYVLVLWLVLVPVAARVVGGPYWLWLSVSGGAAVAIWLLVGQILFHWAARQCRQAYAAVRQTMVNAAWARRLTLESLKADVQRKLLALAGRRQAERKEMHQRHADRVAELHRARDTDLAAAQAALDSRLAELEAHRAARQNEIDQTHGSRSQQNEARRQADTRQLEEAYQRKLQENRQRFQQQWQEMADRWTGGMQSFAQGVDDLNRECESLFLDWEASNGHDWTPPKQIPAAVPFGRLAVDLGQLADGLPQDPALRPARTSFSLPGMFPSSGRSLLLLKASGEGLPQAVAAIQSTMLQMLTAIPPGKVRFTIVDPVGLGENFSAFMHLTDFNDQLVSSRIWTDADHVEHRLAELTGHMENVIQVYLRNEYHTIEEYNRFAGDLAEPYRVLVVANFPTGFSEGAAARLASIVASGARCGVLTILSVDTRLRVPRDFHLADLERHALTLTFSDGRFVCEQPDCRDLPLTLIAPPPADRFTSIVRAVGREAKDADRVELPFECAVPEREQWWTTEGAAGINVPLGRAGAMKLQYLRLGRGTSQHVLIAGKTGSGKSTLLHALIINLALRYSPDEVELYLVDFKKGVEFKDYAQWQLPHARVIAIESEREFGLSVLERLDGELKTRGDAFRNLGVQDLSGFRAARPDAKLPRILLIIDEFQELFTDDDRIAQNASLLLDRLVRQGRAFGIHVLLGSQTLAGSYSLPRSTIGQMAVRIALQCSESDAHLILSEENTAARLLKRPGEAIYNDANGLFEGNHPFQVVWLPDDRRETYLRDIKALAEARHYGGRLPIVFEGNLPADLTRNEELQSLLAAEAWPAASFAPRMWLGAAVAIKDATTATLPRQSGTNVLVVGHQEDEARGVLSSCLLSLAAQIRPAAGNGRAGGAQFVALDGTRADSPQLGYWERLLRSLPHAVHFAPVRTAGAAVNQLAEELARREAAASSPPLPPGEGRGEGTLPVDSARAEGTSPPDPESPGAVTAPAPDADFPPLYVIVFDLARFRDLRKSDDDFGYSRSSRDEPPSPAAQFARLLSDGPALGIHVLLWCDNFHNLNRWIDRQGLRDVGLRIVFQMNVTDSSNLIDSPVASQLGVHRALAYDEGEGRLEKFRPYAPPEEPWLHWAAGQLAQRRGV